MPKAETAQKFEPMTAAEEHKLEDLVEEILPLAEEEQVQAMLQFMECIYQAAHKKGFRGVEEMMVPVNRVLYAKTSHYDMSLKGFLQNKEPLTMKICRECGNREESEDEPRGRAYIHQAGH